MGYKGRHRAPTPLATKLRIPALTAAVVTAAMGLFQGQTAPEAPPPSPVEVTYPTLPPVPPSPPTTSTPAPTATPTPTTTAPTSTRAPAPPPPATTKKAEGLAFPTSGPSYGGVKSHVRKVGWLVDSLFDVDSIGGVGHRARRSDHPRGLALDFMVDRRAGDLVAEFLLKHRKELRVKYVIWEQRYNDGSGWELMEDRGSATENHFDHVHVSFYA